MTPAAIRELRDSFAILRPMADAAAAAFYDRLFASDPALRRMFPSDLRPQRTALMGTLAAAIGAAGRMETLRPQLLAMGARHAGYGVRSEHYAAVRAALLGTLAAALGERFTPAASAAWSDLYGQMAETMQQGVPTPA